MFRCLGVNTASVSHGPCVDLSITRPECLPIWQSSIRKLNKYRGWEPVYGKRDKKAPPPLPGNHGEGHGGTRGVTEGGRRSGGGSQGPLG